MYGLAVIEGMTLSGHLSNIDEISGNIDLPIRFVLISKFHPTSCKTLEQSKQLFFAKKSRKE